LGDQMAWVLQRHKNTSLTVHTNILTFPQ
jgi:hypothetical protein